MSRADIVRDWALSMVGTGYVYGATGWVCTPGRREQQAKQYPQYAGTILGTCKKWDGVVCHDCAQLTKKAMAKAGISLPSGAASQWKADVWAEKGTIGTLPRDKLCLLYREANGKMQHTLIYLGDGRVVDARGSSQGVMLTESGQYKATHWGIPRGLYGGDNGMEDKEDQPMENVAYKAVVTAKSGSTVRMRTRPDTKTGKLIKNVPIGDTVDVLEMHAPEGWRLIRYEGKSGYMMDEFLQDVESMPDPPQTGPAGGGSHRDEKTPEGGPEPLYTVTIRALQEADAAALIAKYGGTMEKEQG